MESDLATHSSTANYPPQDFGLPHTAPTPMRIQCRLIDPSDIDPSVQARWLELEQRALQPNAFLSPSFILPAVRHLASASPPRLALVERLHTSGKSLIGIGIFDRRAPTSRIPFPHLASYRTDHTFTGGLLLDREYAGPALHEFMKLFKSAGSSWLGVAFHDLIASSPAHELMINTAIDHGLAWFEIDRFERPVLVPAHTRDDAISPAPSSRLKNLRRRMNNLRKEGQVHWRIVAGGQPAERSIEKFLELEHNGWKGSQGGSLLSRTGQGDFFRAMATQFLHNRQAFFTELSLDDQVISSTFNLTSGNTGFAFKIAWHPAYEKFSPGILNELELQRAAGNEWPHLTYIDSCAPPGSYLETLWKDRKTVVSGVFATTKIARYLASAREYFRDNKQKLQRWLQGVHALIMYGASVFFYDICDVALTTMV